MVPAAVILLGAGLIGLATHKKWVEWMLRNYSSYDEKLPNGFLAPKKVYKVGHWVISLAFILIGATLLLVTIG
jgi:hypothetical protein